MGTVTLPKDTEFADGEVARGTDVRANDQYLRDFINNGSIGQANLTKSENYAWTGIHTYTVNSSGTTNNALIVSAVLSASVYGHSITSSAAQINAPLLYRALTSTSATQPLAQYVNAGTGATHQVTLRSLAGLNTDLTAAVATSTDAISNSTTETTFSDLTTTLPADFLKAGTTIRIQAWGIMATPGAAPATAQIEVKYGGTAGTVLLDSGAITPATSLVNSLVKVDALLTCISTGGSGTVEAQGTVAWNSNTAPALRGLGTGATGVGNAAVITIDTTAQSDLVLSFTWGTAVADCTFTWRAGSVEVLK